MIPLNLLAADFRRFWSGIIVLILLIAAATALSTVVNLQERALRVGSARAAETFDILIGAPGSEAQLVLSTVFLQSGTLPLLSDRYLRELQDNPAVLWLAPLAFGDSYQGMPIIGTSSTLVTLGGQRNLQQGRSFQSEFEAVAGAGSGMQIGDTFTPLHGQIQQEGAHQHDHIRFTVVGILPKQNNHWDKAILVPIETVWHAHGIDEHEHEQHNDSTGATQAHEPSVSAIVIKSKTIAGAYQIRAQYRSGSTLSVFPAEVLTRLYSTLGDIHYLLALISYGTQALLGVSIMLITIVHLHQRKRQIAALRAFGAPRSAVCALIWLGLIILIFFGLALGAGLGYAVASEIAKHISAQSGFTMPVYFTFNDIKQLFMLLIFASVITLIPALMTYRISPAQALKQ